MATLFKLAVKFGSKVLKVIQIAAKTIMKYGAKAIAWVRDNIGKIIDALAAGSIVYEVASWLKEQLEDIFG